jgi:hypothetical protein
MPMFEDHKYETFENGLKVRKESEPYTEEELAELYRRDQKVVAFTRPQAPQKTGDHPPQSQP